MFLLSESPHEDERADCVLLAPLFDNAGQGRRPGFRTGGCKQQIEEMRRAGEDRSASGPKG